MAVRHPPISTSMASGLSRTRDGVQRDAIQGTLAVACRENGHAPVFGILACAPVAWLLYEDSMLQTARTHGRRRTTASNDEMTMKRRTLASLTRFGVRLVVGSLFAATAFGAVGCEQAMQVAPTSSVLTLTSAATGVDVNGSLAITATVTSSAGKAVSDGTIVTFASTLGTMAPIEARTSNGRAVVQLLAGALSGTASVTATSGSITSSALSVRVGQVPSRIALTATLGSLGSSTIHATVYDSRGLALAGVPVTFTTTAGSLASSTVYTDATGLASTSFFCQTDATVTAASLGVQSTIIVRPGGFGALAVNIGVSPAAPARRQTVTFTATATATCATGSCIARYEWEWSDGYALTTTGNVTTRTFEVFGNYAVIVRAIGLDGSIGTSRAEFFVN